MRKLFLMMHLSIGALAAHAQNCEYALNENDPYLKIRKVETKEVLVYNWMIRLSLSYANYGGQKLLVARVSLMQPMLVSQGDKMIILFEDGDTVELELLSDNGRLASFGETFNAGGISAQNFKLFYVMPPMDKLKGRKLAGVRIYSGQGYIEFPKGKTGAQLGGAGKAEKLKRLEELFSERMLNCIELPK